MASFIREGLHSPFPSKGWDSERWPNFQPVELVCGCRGKFCNYEYFHNEEFLDKLQSMREIMNEPFMLNSGHRCDEYNVKVGGAEGSRHLAKMEGMAADVSLIRHSRKKMFDAARTVGFSGIGLGSTFIHVDNRPGNLTMWDYGPRSRKLWGITYSPWELLER